MPSHPEEAETLTAVELPGALNYGHDINEALSSGAASARTFMLTTLDKAKGVNVRRQTADPTVTKAKNLADVEKLLDKFGEDTDRNLGQARTALASSLANAEAKLKTAINIAPTGSGGEIRSVLRSMSPEQRNTAMRAAFTNGDKEVIGAIIGSNPITHGCDVENVRVLYDEYQRKTAPAEYASIEAHRKYTGYLDNAGISLMAFSARAYKGTGNYATKAATAKAVLASYGVDFAE